MQLPAHMEKEIAQLFARMDLAYDQASLSSGFACEGCKDNCCFTRFYHHTLLEYLYLRYGLAQLPEGQRRAIRESARGAVARMRQMARRGETVRVMCPLNDAGRCALYAWRPMICRLHGIPHLLRRPDGRSATGPGCDDFYAQVADAAVTPLDRTPLYVEMAEAERRLRRHLGFQNKIKMTIAEMIAEMNIDEIL